MKRLIFFAILVAIATSGRMIGCMPERDTVNNTNELNDQKAEDHLTNRDVATFLVKTAEARMTDAQEGWMAAENGSSTGVKDYGKLMMQDQETLLTELRKLARQKNVTLPPAISQRKERKRDRLADETGKKFDRKFIKMMTDGHERDVKLFRQAIDSKDPEVSAFAKKYLPMIESHLKKIEEIKRTGS